MDQDSHIPAEDDEIDLRELFAALVAHWGLIACVSALSVFLAGYYAFVIATPKFKSESVFQMPDVSGRSLGNLGGLASLAGISLPDSGGVNVFDQVQGRDFIVEIASDLGLEQDPFFNDALNPPGLSTRIFSAVGVIGEIESPTKGAILGGIVTAFRENVAVSETKNGAFTVATTHTNPESAARVSNAVVEKVLLKHRDKQIGDRQTRVDYLSGELAKTQEELDRALEGVQVFAIANNMLSVQELMQQSQQLVKMRVRKEEITEIFSALEALLAFLDQPKNDAADLAALLNNQPQLRQREILLMLGEPVQPEAWLALPSPVVSRALARLSAQLVQIELSLTEFQQEAADTAENAAELAILERDVKVATATYEVMVEQFKAQALASGFELSPGIIFETAVPAVKPSQPRKAMVVALGMMLGLFLGAGLALVLSLRNGCLDSLGAIRDLLGPAARFFSRRALPGYLGWQAARLLQRFRKSSSAELAELSFALNSEAKPALILPPSKKEACGLALLAASQLAGENSKTVIVDFFAQIPGDVGGPVEGAFKLESLEPGLEIARPGTAELLGPRHVAKSDFIDELKSLIAGYDQVVLLTAPLDQARYIMGALMALEPLVLTAARPGKITSGTLNRLLALIPEGQRNNEGLVVIC
jgi:uncharacterized protein involved in exopolysaccharide biosynthesis